MTTRVACARPCQSHVQNMRCFSCHQNARLQQQKQQVCPQSNFRVATTVASDDIRRHVRQRSKSPKKQIALRATTQNILISHQRNEAPEILNHRLTPKSRRTLFTLHIPFPKTSHGEASVARVVGLLRQPTGSHCAVSTKELVELFP